MRRTLILGVVLVLAMALGACSTSTPIPPAAASTAVVITNLPTEFCSCHREHRNIRRSGDQRSR